jgi:4-methyl-5(b-hydroxyethyl)-thiazole monophosphate biosynthesis
MPTAMVLIANGSEEIEAVTAIDVLRRAEVAVTVAGLDALDVRASRGVALRADVCLQDVADQSFDLVVLPGGKEGAERLRDDERVLALLRRQHDKGGLIGAICAAPMVLVAAGLLEGRRATSYPGFLQSGDAQLSEEAVVVDGNIITSRGPATAMAFALELVERLCGAAQRRQNADRLLYARYGEHAAAAT